MITPNPSSAMAGFGLAHIWCLMILLREVWSAFRKDVVLMARQIRGIKRSIFAALALWTCDISDEALAQDHEIITVPTAIGIPPACFLRSYGPSRRSCVCSGASKRPIWRVGSKRKVKLR